MTALIGLTAEHNAEVARLKNTHPEVKLPSLFTEIFELPKMSTSTPERKAKQDIPKSPVLDASRDSLDLSTGLEPVSPPGKHLKSQLSYLCFRILQSVRCWLQLPHWFNRQRYKWLRNFGQLFRHWFRHQQVAYSFLQPSNRTSALSTSESTHPTTIFQ